LHGVVSNAADDSITINVKVDTKAPSPKDSTALVEFSYVSTTQTLQVKFRAKMPDVSFIRYSLSDTALGYEDSIQVLSSINMLRTFEPVRMIKISFRDSIGNCFDTAWRYFDKKAIRIYKGSYTVAVDNDENLVIRSLLNSVKEDVNYSPDTAWLYVDKHIFNNTELTALTSSGINPLTSDAYLFCATHDSLNSNSVWQNGLSLHFRADTSISDSMLNKLKIWAYNKRTMVALPIGGVYSAEYVTISGVKFPVINSVPVFDDSIVYFMAIDSHGIAAEKGDDNAPIVFSLGQNYPNPFNPVTAISFSVPNDAVVSLALFAVDGKKVKQLHSGWTKRGRYKVLLNTEKLSSGRYIYRISQGKSVITKMMTVGK
jgi:hypothetical protein